ncbi:MAG: flagellar basal body rod protein FlgC [Gammaproteobacteria bacterium]
MSLTKMFDIAGSAMSAQSVRLNATASNLANVNSVSGDPAAVYRSRQPVFSVDALGSDDPGVAGVHVDGIVQTQDPPSVVHMPEHPEADEDGNVYMSNVNVVEEMVNMIAASRSYQNGVEVAKVSKELLLRTLSLGQ